jgi:hypothetical protein
LRNAEIKALQDSTSPRLQRIKSPRSEVRDESISVDSFYTPTKLKHISTLTERKRVRTPRHHHHRATTSPSRQEQKSCFFKNKNQTKTRSVRVWGRDDERDNHLTRRIHPSDYD